MQNILNINFSYFVSLFAFVILFSCVCVLSYVCFFCINVFYKFSLNVYSYYIYFYKNQCFFFVSLYVWFFAHFFIKRTCTHKTPQKISLNRCIRFHFFLQFFFVFNIIKINSKKNINKTNNILECIEAPLFIYNFLTHT